MDRGTAPSEYEKLLNDLPAEIGVFDAAGRFLHHSREGMPDPSVRAWVIGRTHHDWCRARGYPLTIADRRQAVIEEVVREGRAAAFEEIRFGPLGQRRYFVRTYAPVRGSDGAVATVVGVGQETTSLKKAEETVRSALDESRREVDAHRRAEVELRDALRRLQIEADQADARIRHLQDELRGQRLVDGTAGGSAGMEGLRSAVAAVAPADGTVLITGEPGTGKGSVARAIHEASGRNEAPLLTVHCASASPSLVEAELFGEPGGDGVSREGQLSLANGATLLLDEVGALAPQAQGLLLRFITLGALDAADPAASPPLDVRILAATNRDLKKEAENGRFNQDLFYLLSASPVHIPPLRHRPDDIVPLAQGFLEEASRELRRPVHPLSPADADRLRGYAWPGNVRELRSVMERAVITAWDGRPKVDLPDSGPQTDRRPSPTDTAAEAREDRTAVLTEAEMRAFERRNVQAALEHAGWKVYGPAGAAALLGIKPTTLSSRIKKLGVTRG